MGYNKLIPISIIFSGALIALSIYLSGVQIGALFNVGFFERTQAAERNMDAFIMGNPDAAIKIVEFSDFECPFCARLHPTLERIVLESKGHIAWEYRHFPLPIHRNAKGAAYAAECIGRLGGNEAFWEFAAQALANQRTLSETFYREEAQRLGIASEDFASCMSDENTEKVVAEDINVAMSKGGSGTPFSVVLFEDGSEKVVSGALPYEFWKTLLKI